MVYPFEPREPPSPNTSVPPSPPGQGPGPQIPQPPPQRPGPTFPPVPGPLGNLVPTNLLYWGQSIAYETDLGLRCSPGAQSPTPDPITQATPYQQFWRVHSGKTAKIITCAAAWGINQKAMLPAPSTINPNVNNGNDTLMAWKLVCFTPENFMDGYQLQACVLTLVFECQAVIQLGSDAIDMGASAWDKTPAAQNILTSLQFNALLNQASAAQGFKGGPINY